MTPYMKYHPGGVEELMKGAGKISTDLFNKVHPWVNLTSMLEKCLVGSLVMAPPPNSTPVQTKKVESRPSTRLSLAPPPPPPSFAQASSPSTDQIEPITVTVKPAVPEIPVLDSYQSNTNCIIVLYTKLKSLRKESIVIDKMINNNNFILFLYTSDAVYKYDLGLEFFD